MGWYGDTHPYPHLLDPHDSSWHIHDARSRHWHQLYLHGWQSSGALRPGVNLQFSSRGRLEATRGHRPFWAPSANPNQAFPDLLNGRREQ